MKYLKPICLIFFLGLFSLVLVNQAEAATDFVSVIDPGNGAGADYTSLSAWEAAVQSDLTVATTKVFSWSTASGTIPDLGSVTGLFSGATASATHMTASTTDTGSAQILLTNINGTFQSGEQVYLTSTGASSTYAVLSDAGDSAIAVATCRTSDGSPDTTAVIIDGCTTSATNYIKIWTDPDEPYRHRGVWDESGYRLELNNDVILDLEEYARIDGLQIYKTGGTGSAGIIVAPTGAGDVRVSNSIVRGSGIGGSESGILYGAAATGINSYTYNNIVYDFDNGIRPYASSAAYVYSNTVYNSTTCISQIDGSIIKNNITNNCTDSFYGTYNVTSTNNINNQSAQEGAFGASADSGNTDGIGSDTFKLRNTGQDFSTTVKVGMIVKNTTDTTYSYVTAVNSNTELTLNDDIMDDSENYTIYTNMFGNVTFENEEYDDFHLDSSDTVAKEKGADLSADANLPITDDIDGDVRTDALPGRLYDIGADENIAKIYRSVGPSATTALITGTTNYQTNHLTISGLYATFELPLPDNIGVGDAIQYDDDNDGDIDADDSLVFIDKRLSSQKYRVKTSSGGAPAETVAPDIDWLIYRAYISLSNAEAGTENTGLDDDLESFELFTDGRNIKTNQEQWNIACYANSTTADTASTTIDGWTTSASAYMKIYTPTSPSEVGESQRHSGVWNMSKYYLSMTNLVALNIYDNYINLDGLQITGDGYTNEKSVIYIANQTNGSNKINISNLYINRSVPNNIVGEGIYIYDNGTVSVVNIWNSIIIGSGNYNYSVRNACIYNYNGILNIYNSTLETSSSNATGLSSDGTTNVKNVYASATQAYRGTRTMVNAASSDTTGSAGLQNIAFSTANFMNVTTGSEDLRLTVGSALKNVGTDLISDLSYRKLMRDQMPVPGQIGGTDITSQGYSDDTVVTRPYNTPWDIGAHEVITKIYRSVAPDADGNMAAIDDDNSQADTLSIATSGLATFEVAVADNVGVGDALIFDDDDDNDLDANDTLLFIHGRTDSTHYTVRTDTGDFPTASTTDNDKWAIYRAYTSLFNAEAGTKNTAIPISFTGGNRDIKANSEQWHIACYANTATNKADTTGVIINDWTTAPQNYLRLYTPYLSSEVGTSQRHNGKWDDSKYNLTVSLSGWEKGVFDINDENIIVEGLQIKQTNTTHSNQYGVVLRNTSGLADFVLSESILDGVSSAYWGNFGVYLANMGRAKLLNNVIYNFRAAGSYPDVGIRLSENITAYVYNNTVYNCGIGFHESIGILVAKNNIAYNNTDNYWSTSFDGSSTNNLSGPSQTDAPGSNPRNAATVTFLSTATGTKDFHLAQQDTGAKGYGADLSQDPIWQRFMAPPACVQTPCQGVSNGGQDIDGAKRPVAGSGNNWDIGADQTATPIYRSLAPSATTALDTGSADSNYLTISGSTLTVGTATPDNIGVGDVIQYDSNNDGAIDAVAFIISRVSSSEYTVKSAVGGPPVPTLTPDLDWSIFRSYSTLANAEKGDENSGLSNTIENFDDWTIGGTIDADDVGRDIWTNNEQWNIAAYANGTTGDGGGVYINGWITGLNNIVKIYTPYLSSEVGISQRHSGKFDTSKYFISSISSIIRFYTNYTNVDGLQIKITGTSSYHGAFGSVNAKDGAVFQISNNIIAAEPSGSAYNWHGIPMGCYWSGTRTWKIFNNIIYGLTGAGGGHYAISVNTCGSGNAYIYNNTIYNNNLGIQGNYGAVVKNNISYSNTDNYFGPFSASSTHNLSSDDTAPAYGTYYRNATVDFADAANKDFHLAASDTGARDKGADLSDDPIWQEMTRIDSINFPYGATSTDIDGHTRSTTTHSGAWDIGADEAATPVYFAVGQNTTDHKTGSPLITVDPDTRIATFTVAQTAANLGVGDEIDYDTDNKKCYITDKISTSVWKCRTATGFAPWAATDATVNAVKHAFASLNSAVNATLGTHAGDSSHLDTTDLWTNNYQLNLPCYYDSGPDTTAVTVDGWTTGVPNYVKIYTPTDTVTEANARQRHWGKWDEGKWNIYNTNTNVIYSYIDNIWIDGLQIKLIINSGTSQRNALIIDNGNNDIYLIISDNIISGELSGGSSSYFGINGVYSSGGNGKQKIYNNKIYNFSLNESGAGMYLRFSGLAYVDNNTIINCYNGLVGLGPGWKIAINNLIYNCDNAAVSSYFAAGTDYNATNNSVMGYTVSGGGNIHDRLSQNFSFIDEANSDFHLSSTDTAARNAGADLSADANFAFDKDIDGSARNIDGQGWDIGADETATPVYYSVGQDGVTDRKVAATVDISSSTGLAAFSADQTGNIGVGDAVEYGTPTTTAYIASKQDQSHWYLITVTGAFPDATTTATVHSIKRVFSSLSSAEATAPTLLGTSDLHANNYQLNLPCYYDTGPDQTAVTIDGWTTAPQDYIKVYTPNNTNTEANASQRHQGVWDEGKYQLTVIGSSNYLLLLRVRDNYFQIDGLQMKAQSSYTGGQNRIILFYDYGYSYTNSLLEVKNSLLDGSDSISIYGIQSIGPSLIYNNQIYKCTSGLVGDGGYSYFYNNTIYNCSKGVFRWAGTLVVKNNLSFNNNVDYYNNFSASSTHNLSSDNTAPAYGTYYRNASVSFLDPDNNDFRLLPTDTGAKDKGIEVSDSSIDLESLQSDIAGNERYDGYWDIGAFEAPTILYRSVGNDQSNLAGDANTVTIASSTATFANALPNNVGVGDVIQYGQSGAYQLAFITDRSSSTEYAVQARTGALPSATSTAPAQVFRGHEFLDDWEDQLSGDVNDGIDDSVDDLVLIPNLDLAASNTAMFVPCYASTSPDNLSTIIDGWTTATTSYIKIYTPVSTSDVGESQRHAGKWDEGKYRLALNNYDALIIQDNFIRIDGLQIAVPQIDSYYDNPLDVNTLNSNNYIVISANVIKGENGASGNGQVGININDQSAIVLLDNNVIYGIGQNNDNYKGIAITNCSNAQIYNNTVSGAQAGIKIIAGLASATNNVLFDNIYDFFGNFLILDHNASDDATGTNAVDLSPARFATEAAAWKAAFVDYENYDFRVRDISSVLYDAGASISLVTDDIIGNTRPKGDHYDIGAFEYAGQRPKFRLSP